jgi:tRNA(adenine34) deaminase
MAEQQLNHHTEVIGGVMAEECGNLLSTFFKLRRLQSQQQQQ